MYSNKLITNILELELKMLRNSYTYSVEYDSDTTYSCEESGCYEEGICRCGQISNAAVTYVDILKLTVDIYDQLVDTSSTQGKRESRLAELFYGGPEVDRYCIHRILTRHKVWDTNNWTVGVSGGYYGDEIGDISLNDIVFKQVSKDCYDMLQFSSIGDKLRFVLSLEYGYLLGDIQQADFEIVEITKDDIDFNKLNQNHINNVRKENLSYYRLKYDLPRGVVRKSGTKYKIIDGFHRIISAEDGKTFRVFTMK